MSKDHRMGGKQQHGNSRKSYFAMRAAGLAKDNKLARIAKNERLMAKAKAKKNG